LTINNKADTFTFATPAAAAPTLPFGTLSLISIIVYQPIACPL
jgi:hypothetical protein